MSPDPFSRWAALQAASTDPSNRLDAREDLAFWERVADEYDAQALARRVPAVLQRVCALVPPGASVLDIGAGTGAFALPLSQTARYVTALDHSPAMLRVLQRRLAAEPRIDNVRAVLGALEDTDVEPHDVVLAANALYRTRNLRGALEKIVHSARQRGVVVWSVGRQDWPQHTVRECVQPGRYRPGPDYVHVVDGLFGLDVFAHVEVIDVDDTQHFATDAAAAAGLLSWQPITPEEQARVSALLPRLLERGPAGWTWPRRGRIAVIWWDQQS